jgi:hypothetical protein
MTLQEAEARYRNSQIERHNACVYLQKAAIELGENTVKAANEVELKATPVTFLPLLGSLLGVALFFIPGAGIYIGQSIGIYIIIGGIAGCIAWTISERKKVNRKKQMVSYAKQQLDIRITKLNPDTMTN